MVKACSGAVSEGRPNCSRFSTYSTSGIAHHESLLLAGLWHPILLMTWTWKLDTSILALSSSFLPHFPWPPPCRESSLKKKKKKKKRETKLFANLICRDSRFSLKIETRAIFDWIGTSQCQPPSPTAFFTTPWSPTNTDFVRLLPVTNTLVCLGSTASPSSPLSTSQPPPGA